MLNLFFLDEETTLRSDAIRNDFTNDLAAQRTNLPGHCSDRPAVIIATFDSAAERSRPSLLA